MKKVKLKICGMKYSENIQKIAMLKPDYLGFIFWDKSIRKYEQNEITNLDLNIKKVGVFVDSFIDEILHKIKVFKLDVIQLHGTETDDFCRELKKENIKIIKAFSVDNNFDFNKLNKYKNAVDYFLFDTKGKLPGGNGLRFDWHVLEKYTLKKPFFLSGGIGLTEIDEVKKFLNSDLASYCYAIDINSRFEDNPGVKNKNDIKKFKKLLYENKI